MMSSETSTEVRPVATGGDDRSDAAFQPWQLFTLAGLVGAAVVAFFAADQPHSVRIALILTVFAAAAIGLAALRVLAPFTGTMTLRGPEILGGRTRAALEREKTLVLRSIKELEFDHAMGKVSERDFADMSARLRGRAARLIRQLDAGVGYRSEIEMEIERRLSRVPQVQAQKVPPLTAAPAARLCTCGTSNDVDARFCKECGARLEAA